MTDPAFVVRAGQAGAIVRGTPGNLLAFDTTGEGLEGVPPPSGAARPFAWVAPPNDEDSGNPPFFNVAVDGVLVEANPASAGFLKVGSSEFALFGSTPKLIYTGPNCTALVRVVMAPVVAALANEYGLGISLSGDLVGVSIDTFAFLSKGGSIYNNNGGPAIVPVMATERAVALVSGSTLDVVFAGPAQSPQQTRSYSMAVQVVG